MKYATGIFLYQVKTPPLLQYTGQSRGKLLGLHHGNINNQTFDLTWFNPILLIRFVRKAGNMTLDSRSPTCWRLLLGTVLSVLCIKVSTKYQPCHVSDASSIKDQAMQRLSVSGPVTWLLQRLPSGGSVDTVLESATTVTAFADLAGQPHVCWEHDRRCLSLHCNRYNKKYQTFCGSCDVFPFDAHWTVAELCVCREIQTRWKARSAKDKLTKHWI